MEIYLGNALTASDLDHDTQLSLAGDITGNVTFGYDQLSLTMNTSASNIISDTAEPNKALKLDANSILQAKSSEAEKLDHDVTITLSDDVTGSATWNTSTNAVTIKTKLSSTSKALTEDDLGKTVASLDSNGIIHDNQLPDGILNALKLTGSWSGTVAPVSNPKEGQAWLVDNDCTFSGMNFKQGDWIYYFNNSWNRADISNGIHSVNGKTGNSITLSATDVKAISDSYINYTIGGTVPQNKIPVADKDGHLAGVTVDKVTKAFEFKTQGDIKVDTSSNSKTTDGSRDLDVKLLISEDGYTNIQKKLQRDIYINNVQQPFKKKLYISGTGIDASSSGDVLSIDFSNIEAIALQSPVKINGTDFDGSVDITTTNWGTARNISIADSDSTNTGTAVSVNGSANVTLKLPATIKAALSGNATSATKATQDSDGNTIKSTYLKLSGGTMTGTINSQHLIPKTNNTYNLGSSSMYFSSAYIKTHRTDIGSSWVDSAKQTSAIYMSNTSAGSLKSIASIPSTNGRFILGSVNNSFYAGYITNTNINAGTNTMTKTNTICDESGNMIASGRMSCAALTVNGKKVFIQSGTPSGAANGDIWIVTK